MAGWTHDYAKQLLASCSLTLVRVLSCAAVFQKFTTCLICEHWACCFIYLSFLRWLSFVRPFSNSSL